MKQAKYTIQQFNRDFPDNTACLEYLFKARFSAYRCPKCARIGQYHLQGDTSHYVCNCGGHQLSPKNGTIFEKSDTDLYKWFYAIFLMSTSKNGVAAKEIERQVGVTYKTAWRMAKQIRSLMEQVPSMFSGTVEADETYVGGKRRGKRGRGAEGKTPVVGVVERKGDVHAEAVADVKAPTVMKLVRENVRIGTSLMTDKFASYDKASRMGYRHRRVDHGRGEYVRGNAHTNTIEGFWSGLKRGVDGTHHSVSPKMLQSYLDFYAFHWNGRNAVRPLFSELLERVA